MNRLRPQMFLTNLAGLGERNVQSIDDPIVANDEAR